MGEFRLHHIKFFDYTPSTIQCISYDKQSNKVAVSRADASIEVWSLTDRWYQERVIPGSQKRRVDTIAWAKGRLFSAGLLGDIVEYDLKKQAPKKSTHYGYGFWCMTCNHAQTHLATGSEDGCVRLYEVSDEGVLFERALDNQESRIVSLAWHITDEVIVTGSVDNIRVWNVATGHAIQRISVQRSPVLPTIVWSVALTKDLTIVSGDSSGRTQFWNGKTGTLLRSFASHKADVQTVCTSPDGTMVFSSGVHPLIAKFELVDKDRSGMSKMWVPSRSRVGGNDHTHDVKVLAVAGDFLVSGGVDTNLVVNSTALVSQLQELKRKRGHDRFRQKILSFPHRNLVSCASKAKLVLLQYPTYLELWKLGSTHTESGENGDQLPLAENPVKILQLKVKGTDHIACSALSRCGTWLAYSDVNKVKLYNVSHHPPSISKVPILPPSLKPAQHMVFTPDNKLILASQECSIQVLGMDTIQPTMMHSFTPLSDSIHLLAVSAESELVAAADLSGDIHVYSLPRGKMMKKLPGYKHLATAMTFDPESPELLVAYSDRSINEFNTQQGSFSKWSRKVYKQGLHPGWLARKEPIVHLTFNPENVDQFIAQDQQSFTVIDRSKPLPKPHQKLFKDSLDSKQKAFQEKKNEDQAHGFSICQKYKPLLFAGFTQDPGWLAIVERPTQAILETLPLTLQQKKFAT